MIDSGLHRRASFSWWSGIPSLKTRLISRASAIQRAGRAGRTGPGLCYRLYTQGDFETRPGFEAPEIMRSDLSQVLLDLKALGVDLRSFTWFDAPPAAALQAAEDLLHQLGATDAAGGLTEVGREMSRVPAHPRVSRMLMEASARGVLEAASWLGAALTEGRLEDGPVQESWSGYSRDHSLRKSQQLLIRSAEGWAKRTQRPGVPVPTARGSEAHAEALARSILAGFPDRVAQKRKLASSVTRGRAEDVELLLSSGGSALVAETQMTAGEEFLVLLDLQEQQTQNQKKASLRVRSWVAIQADWLLDIQPVGMIEKEECTWDAVRNRVQSSSRWMYGELVLSESALNGGDPQEVHRLLIKHGLGVNPEIASPVDWVAALTLRVGSSDEGEIESAFARAQLYQDYFKSEPRSLWSQLSPILEGKSSLTELKEIDWPKEILQCLLGDAAHHLGELLPTQLVLPSGRKAKIHYRLAQAPWVQSRLQDFFGMKKGPVLLQGRLPLLIHLLAPNYRPVQVTSDLESFWKNHYPQLRPALSRRYPRHSWPENPGLASEK